MRCSICDYSRDTTSPFFDGLESTCRSNGTRLIPSKNGVDYYCEQCYHDIINTMLGKDEDDLLEDDSFVLANVPEV